MAIVDEQGKRVTFQVVYAGPALVGKTTNLAWLREFFQKKSSSPLEAETTERGRLQSLRLSLGSLRGWHVLVEAATASGGILRPEAWPRLLENCDGIVFVADSQKERLEANRWALDELCLRLRLTGAELRRLPQAIQANKRDLEGIATLDDMKLKLPDFGGPLIPARALEGKGVLRTFRGLVQGMLRSFRLTGKPDSSPCLDPLSSTPMLIRSLLTFPDEDQRAEAAYLLGRRGGGDEVRDALARALRDGSSQVRAQAALAWGRRPASEGLGPLLEMLLDRSPSVRIAAGIAAARRKAVEAIGILRSRLPFEPEEVRLSWEDALRSLLHDSMTIPPHSGCIPSCSDL